MEIKDKIQKFVKLDPIQGFFPYDIVLDEDTVILKTKCSQNTLNIFKTCHGGILCVWSDAVLSATASYFTGKTCITTELSCSFKKPILPDEEVTIITQVLDTNETKIEISANILVKDQVVASSKGKFYIVKDEKKSL